MRFFKAKRGQVFILMAVVMVAILGLTFLASIRTFKPTPRDPATPVATVKAEVERAVFNALAYASQKEDPNVFNSTLSKQLRNIALVHYGASASVSSFQPPRFSWGNDRSGKTGVSVNVSATYSTYNMSWVNRYSLAFTVNVLNIEREDLGAFTKLKFTVNFTMNAEPSLFNRANVTVGAETYDCQLTKNFGDGKLQLEATVLFTPSISGQLAIEDVNRVVVKCVFTV